MKYQPFRIFIAITFCLSLTTLTLAQRSAAPVNLTVTIDDGINQYGIHSDGNGPYINGQNTVSAVIGQYGYFTLNSGNRLINAVYPDPQPSTNLPIRNVVITTFADGTFLQNLPVGVFVCKGLAVNIHYNDTYQTKRTIGYKAGSGDLSQTGSVKISRIDNDTWWIESDNLSLCGNNLSNNNIARIVDSRTKGKSFPPYVWGLYAMPLRLILTRQ